MSPIIVSACLLGIPCRYDGGHKKNDLALSYIRGKDVVPLCPECLAGLRIPRPPAQFDEGDGQDALLGRARVTNTLGEDLTGSFTEGAEKALKVAQKSGATTALLKERSPSCGLRQVHDTRGLRNGMGIFTALLVREGISILSEEDLLNINIPSP